MHELSHYLSERAIIKSYNYSANLLDEKKNTLPLFRTVSNGDIKQNKFIQVTCNNSDGFYSVTLRFTKEYLVHGIAIRYRIRNWNGIKYLAVGCNFSGKFHHVKVTNPLQEKWQTVFFSFNDLSYLIQNDFKGHTEGLNIKEISLKVKGEANPKESFIDILDVNIWSEDTDNINSWIDIENHNAIRNNVVDKVHDYQTSSLKNYIKACEQFYQDGSCPIVKNLHWPDQNNKPPDLIEVNTYRYSWHALHHVANMILFSKIKASPGGIEYARKFTESWIENSWLTPDEDVRFTWYDHGTAERQMSLLMIYHECIRSGKNDGDLLDKIKELSAIQGRLLESEIFYARNQLERHHNHAMFQDVALIITALSFPNFVCSKRWLQTAVSRLGDQINQLIVREGRFSIFVENSIGYHSGIIRLLKFSSELIALFDKNSFIHAIYAGMEEFSKIMQYPDGRSPAQGDTQRLPNTPDEMKFIREQKTEFIILPKSGYGIVKGSDTKVQFMFAMFATALSRTHKHQDNLSFTLFFDMLEWLIDPSHYSHEYEEPISKYLRSASAHNVIALPSLIASIDTGLTKLEGFQNKDSFIFKGENISYPENVIKRTVKGQLNKLEFKFKDKVESSHLGMLEAKLMLHCGEHIRAKQDGNIVILSSKFSESQLRIELPNDKISIINGLVNENNVRGVSGLGFMEFSNIDTIECLVPINQEFSWKITAEEKTN